MANVEQLSIDLSLVFYTRCSSIKFCLLRKHTSVVRHLLQFKVAFFQHFLRFQWPHDGSEENAGEHNTGKYEHAGLPTEPAHQEVSEWTER